MVVVVLGKLWTHEDATVHVQYSGAELTLVQIHEVIYERSFWIADGSDDAFSNVDGKYMYMGRRAQNDDIDAGKATARVPDRRPEQILLEFGIWNLGSFDF
jgi:hypothetical protein